MCDDQGNILRRPLLLLVTTRMMALCGLCSWQLLDGAQHRDERAKIYSKQHLIKRSIRGDGLGGDSWNMNAV
jgi:hypothetical protein